VFPGKGTWGPRRTGRHGGQCGHDPRRRGHHQRSTVCYRDRACPALRAGYPLHQRPPDGNRGSLGRPATGWRRHSRLDSEAEQIALDRASIALEDARARLQRLESLRASNTVTTVQVSEADLAVRNAELALRDAELALERREIISPIDGIVGIISVSAGNYVTSQTEIATVDDRSQIMIDFWVPERFSSMLAIGAPLTATSVARANDNFSGEIIALDNRIDPQSRTLRVQASVENLDDTLRAGMSFQVEIRFPGDSFPAVDPLAIQWGTEGAFVWAIRDGVAERQAVRIIQRNTDNVLVSADLPEGMEIVTEGVHNVREGREVRIADRPGASDEGTRSDSSMPSARLPSSGT
jgi:RND family efflux transporter MFP subunit